MPTRKEIGYAGEAEVCRYLEERGFSVALQNYTTAHGEIDIIAKDEKYIVFCEVKTRKDLSYAKRYGRPAKAVNEEKREHLLYAAKQYLREHAASDISLLQPRMDVAEVWYTEGKDGLRFRLRYIERAFGASGGRSSRRIGGEDE